MPFDANGRFTPAGGWLKPGKKKPEIDLEELNRQIQVEQAPAPVQPPAPSPYQIPGAPMMHSPFDIVNALDKYKLPDLMGQPMQQPQSIMQQPQPKIESNWQPTTVGQPPPDAIGPYQDNRNFMQKSGDWLKSVFNPQGQIHKQIQAGAYEFGEGLAGPIPDLLMGKDASQQARETIHQENLQQISPEVAKGLNIAGTATGAVAGGEALAPFRALQGLNAMNRVKTVPGALKATQTLGRTGADRLITTAGNTALTGMGAEVIQGMTTPDLQNRNTLEQMGAGLAAGSGDMNYGIGAGLDWLSHKDNGIGNYARQMGFQNLAEDMMKTGEATQKGYSENYEFGWKSLINPNYYVYNVSKMLPFTAATLPLGFGGAAVVDSLIAETGMSAFGKNVLRSIGAGTATAPFEAATEAGQVYEDMRKKGMTAEEADKAANKTFWGNVGLLSLTNAGEFATAFMPKGLARGFDNPGVRLGMGAVTEGGQEMGQEAVSRYAKGEPIRMDANMLEQGLLGGIMGMGFGALGSIGNHEDTIHSIQNRTLDKLDQETKVDLQAAIEDARAQGISEEEAMSQVMDALADSPDAKHQQAIHDATQEEFQSKAIDKLNSDPAFVDNIVEQLSAQQPVDQAATTPEPVPAAPTPDMTAPVQQPQPMQPAPAPMPQDTALAPTNAPVTGQAARAAINRGAQPGDTVTLRGKGDQKFTVVGHGAKDMLKLRSEKGGELTIHKKAVSGIISDGAAPAASERNAQTIKDEYAQLGKQLDSMVRARADELKAQNDASGSKSAGSFYEEALQEFHAGSNPEFTQLYERHDNLLGELDTAKATEAKAAREAAGATPAANRPEPVTEQKKGEGGYKAGDRVKVNGENVTIRDVNPDGSYKGNYFNGSSTITMQFKADQVQEHTYSAPELKVGDTISFDDPFAKLTTKGGVLQPKPKMQAKIIRFSGDNAIVELTTKNGKPFGHPVGFYSLEVVPQEEAPANEDKPKNQSVPREAHEFNQADFLDPEKSGHRAVKKQGRGEWEMSYPDGRSWNKSILDKHKDEKAAAKHFHKQAVLDAIRSGKTVSAGVLKDYPDLKKLYEIQQRFVKTISIDYDTVYVKSGEWDKSFKLYDYPETGNSYAQNKFVLEYIPTEFLNAKIATSGNSNIDALYVEQSLNATFRRKIDEFQQDAMINLVGSSFSKTETEDMAAIFRVAEQYVHDVKKAEYADMLDALDQAVRGEFDKVKTPMFQNLDKLWQAGSVHIKNEEALKMPGIHRFVGLVRYAEVAKALLGGRFDQAAASGEMTAVNISAAFQWTPFDFPERFRKLEEEQRKKKIAEIQARDLAEAKAMSESDAKDYVAKKAAKSVTEWVMSGDLARAKKHLKDVYRNSGYSGGPVAFGIGGPRKGGIRLADGREFNMTEADYVNRTIDWARRLAGQSNDGFATQHDEALLNLVHSAGHDDSITQAIDKGNMKKARKEFDHVLDTYALDGDNSLDSADRDHLFQRFVELHKSGKLAELQAKGEWQQVHKKGMADKVAAAAASEEPAADQVVQSINAAKDGLPAKQFKMLAFAISNRPSEIEAVRRATPETILLSYGVWGGRADVGKVIEQIGYKPTIIMDSGAFTRYDAETGVGDTGGILDIMDAQADNYGDDISGFAEQLTWEAENLSGEKEGVTELHKFVKWYLDNKDHVNYVFNFDNLQDGSNQDPFAENATYGDRSMYAFRLLRAMDIPVIPVFHYGADPKVLEWYVDQGADYIALGKTAKGIGENERAEWAREIVEQYPDVKFHLLGTNNQRLIDKIPGLHSADGARWVFAAIDKGGDRVDAMTKEMQEREKKALGKVSEDELNRQIVDMRKRDFLQDRKQLSQKTVDELQLIAKLNAYPHTGKKQEIIDRIIHFTRQLEKIGDMTREELEAMNAGDLRDLLRSVKERNNYGKSSLVNKLVSLNETFKERGDWQAKSYLHDNGFGPEQPKLTIKNITKPGDRVALYDPVTKEDLQTGDLVRWIDDVTAEVKWDTGETETVSGFDLQKRRTDEQKAASATKGQEHANMSKWFADKNRDNWTPTHFYDGHPVETMDMPARDMIAYRYKEIRSELSSNKLGGEIKKSDAVEMAKLKPLGQSDQTGEFKEAAQTDQVDELQTEINNLAAEIESRIDGTVQEMQAGAGEMNVEDIRKRIMQRGGIAPYRDGHLKEEYKGIPLSLRNGKGLPLDQMADELGMSEHDLLLTLTGKKVKPNYEDLAKRKLQDDPEFTALQQTYDDLVQELDKLQGKAAPAANTEVKTVGQDTATQPAAQPEPPAAPKQVKKQTTFGIYRRDAAGTDQNAANKPHGLYVSLADNPDDFQSPHMDVGDTDYTGTATPKNPLFADEMKVKHERFRGGSNWVSAGVASLKKLVPEQFDALLEMKKAELVNKLNQEFPGPDYSKYDDSYELLEAYAGQQARKQGYDAIVLYDKQMSEFSEIVLLSDDIHNLAQKKEETPNESTQSVGQDGGTPLEGVPAENVPGAAPVGETGTGSVPSPREDGAGNEQADSAGDDSAGSVGTSQGEVDTPSGRGNDAEPVTRPSNPKGANYSIPEDADLGLKGKKTSYRDNVAAIRLMKEIMAEGRPATPEEKDVLVKYVGWGGIAEPFSPDWQVPQDWKTENAELKELLTPEEFKLAADTILNAHYTSLDVIRAMYAGLQHFGFENGRILEPSMGIGHFLGAMPKNIANKARVTGIELDAITGNIGKLLYPNADIGIQGFEQTTIADNFYDVAIGNVPFGNYGIYDPEYDKKGLTKSIHNYFFAKSIDKVRPGGVVMFLTSRYTMDGQEQKLRAYLASKADLIGAVRLPNTAFKKNAGTEVVTDLIILRKREQNTAAADTSWLQTQPMEVGRRTFEVNSYYHDHPEMVMGDFDVTSFRGGDLTVTPDRDRAKLQEQIANAIKTYLPANIITKRVHKATEAPDKRDLLPAPGYVKENAFHFVDGKLHIKEEGQSVPADVPKATLERIKGLISIRDALRDYFQHQMNDAAENVIQGSRKRLNAVYDAFVKANGPINATGNVRAYQTDPDFYLLTALEKYDAKTKTAKKADVFSKRTIEPYKPVEKTDNAKDALTVAQQESGSVNMDRMMQLTGMSEEGIAEELKGIIYRDPILGWVSTDEYLSGNVRAKLAEAENAAKLDPIYQENVDALNEVQPVDLTEKDISVRLGAGWVPTRYIQEFASHILGLRSDAIRVGYNEYVAEWTIEIPDDGHRRRAKTGTDATVKWGTRDVNALDLLVKALNYRNVQVWAKDGNGKRYTVQKATVAAREKLESIKTEYVKWIWSDEARKNYLLDYYNRTYNTERLREYDGSHLQFPGMNPGITLKAHQKAAVWRAIQNPNTLFAHAVGAGKTFEMIASMMELKRMGLIKKPMWTVPNHLVEQMGQDFMKLYPSANILVATKKDFESKKRQSLMARIATGEFDAVIVAHSSFAFIPLSMERSQAFFDAQLEHLELAIQQEVQSGKRKDSGIAKAVRKARKSLETRMRKQLGRLKKDQAVSFEEMGVDAIVVDEAHEFKNLFYFTKNSRVGGLGDPEGSSKAFDLLMKAQYIQAMNGRTIFATGTPVANSMAEMFTMMRYLSPDELQSRGISHFDAWASLFGELGKELELAPEGKGYRIKEKFKNFANVAELKRLFRKFADVQMADELLAKGLIKRPELKGGKREVVIVSASAELTKYVDELGERANAVRENRVKPDVDNMLKIVSDGRKAALDMRLVDPSLRENPISKLNHAADNLFRIYKETTGVYAEYTNDEGQPEKVSKGAQLVFLDLSTPKGEKTDKEGNVIQDDEEEQQNISIYDELRKKLIKKGVPPKEIAFIHDYKTDAKKLELYGMVNEGKIRFLLGSTFKMGAGMNVQERLVALHHLDVPWRPSDIEQREGRILRQGNLNPEVQIFTYNTEGSFDAYMWQVIANKAAMIETGMNNDMSIRTMQDFSDSTLSAREAMALASGDVRVMELENLRVEVDTLEVKLQNAIETEWNIKRRLQWQPNKRSKEKSLYDAYKATLDSIEPATGDHFKVVVDGKTYTKRIDGGDALLAKVELLKEKGKDGITKVGTFGSLPIVLERKTSEDVLFPDVDVTGYLEGKKGVKAYFSVSDSNLGQVRSLEIALERIEPRVKEIADELAHIDEETGKLNEQLDAAAAERSEMEQTLSEKRMRRDALAEELNMDKPEDQVLDGLDDNASDDSEDDGDSGDGSQGRSYAMASGSAATSGGTKQRKPRKTPINRAIEETKIKLTPKATAKLADLLADTLDVVVGEDFVRQRAEGTFTPSSGATRVRGRSYYDWRVVGHELGHAFSHKFGRPGDEKELKQMIQLYPRQGRGIPAADKPEEGFAEFFRQWAADPVLARKNAPQTAKLFEQFIEGNPDLNEIFAKIRTIVDADLADTALGRAVAGVISSEITDDGTLYGEDQYRVSGAAKFTFEAMDFTIPAKAMMRAARKRGANLKIELDKLLAVVGDAKAKALSNFKGQAKDHQGRFIGGRPLLDIMQEGVNVIGDATGWTTIKLKTLEKESPIYKQYRKMGAMDIFSAITISLRIMERSDKGFDKLPMPPEMAEEILQIAEDRYPEALKLATEYTATLSNIILTKLERVGILTPKTRKTIERGSQFYIPFIYDEKAAARMNGRSGGGRTNKNPVKRFKGKVAPILDVFQASMLKLAEVEQAIEYKRVIESIHDIAAAEGMGAFAQFVPAPKTAVNISTEQIAEKIEKILGDDVDVTDILADANMTFFMNGGLEKVDPNKPVIMNIRNGRPHFIELAPDVYRMLMSMKPVQIEGIARGLAWLSKIARHTALVTPRYIANAVARDAGISLVQSKAPVHSLVKHSIQASSAIMGLGEQGDAIYQDFVNSGGFSGSAHGMILNQLTRQHDTSIIETKAPDWYRLSLKGGKKVLSLVWNGGPNVIRFFEEGPRIAVYIATWKREVGKIEDENGDLYDADKLWNDYLQGGTDALPEDVQEEMERILLEGSYNSREITTNFGLHGVHEAVRKYVPTTAFLHGTIQGTYRTVRNVRENKGKTALITGIGFTLISVISWALMNGDPEREKDYQDMDSSARDKYWWFPTLQKGVYFAIAKPFDYAIPMNMVERFMDHAWSKYPNARKTMADLGSLFSTVTNTQVMNTVVNTMWGMSKNETSLGGKIVPDSDRNKAKDLQYSTTTSLTARKLAEFAADLTGDPTKGVSPRMIDYFIKQNFGRWGAAGLKTTDSLGTLLSTGELPPGGPSGIEYAPLVGQLFYGQAEGSSRIVEKFYKDYNKAQTLSGSVKQLMKDKVKEAPSWATEDNIKLLKSLPSMSSISDGLSASRKEYDADIKNATTPELKRQLTLQKDFVEKLAAGLMYGVEPAAPEDAGLDEKKIRSIRTRFKYDAATSTTNERNRSGGASEEAAYLAKLLKNK